VRALGGKLSLHRHLDGGTNYAGQDELVVNVGLGTAKVVDELRLEWADGTVTLMRDVAANQSITVVSGERSDLDHDGYVDGSDLGVLLAAWGEIDPVDERDLNADGAIDVSDMTVLLSNWFSARGRP
jgi:hypothetical protein